MAAIGGCADDDEHEGATGAAVTGIVAPPEAVFPVASEGGDGCGCGGDPSGIGDGCDCCVCCACGCVCDEDEDDGTGDPKPNCALAPYVTAVAGGARCGVSSKLSEKSE